MTLEEWCILTLVKGRLEGVGYGVENVNAQTFLWDTAEIIGEVLDKAQERGLINEGD